MPQSFKDMPSERLTMLINHPIHREIYSILAGFIVSLRSCRSFEDYYNFQQGLLDATLELEQHWSECAAVVTRLRHGSRVPPKAPQLKGAYDLDELQAWELERDVCERGVRQLKSIGDALAWRVFNYERRIITALCQNQGSGRMYGQKGLSAERAFVKDAWERNRCFVLLHDLTSCIRIGDATVLKLSGDGTEGYLREIKTNPSKRNPKQMRRLRAAEDAIRSGTPLPGDETGRMVALGIPYKTHLGMLANAFEKAATRGVVGMKVPGGRALIAAYLPRGYELWSEEEFLEKTRTANDGALKRAGIRGRGHHVGFFSVDSVGQSPTTPPWASYPFPPDVCASLATDVAAFAVTISSDSLVEILHNVGLNAQWVLPSDVSDIKPGQVVLRASNDRNIIEMRRLEMTRLLQELPDLSVWAEALKELLESDGLEGHPWPYFSSEYKIWE